MKVSYHFLNGDFVEVETDDKFGIEITDCLKEEDANNHKQHYHRLRYDLIGQDQGNDGDHRKKYYEGMEYAAPDTPESLMVDAENEAESNARYRKALSLLTVIQRKRMLMLASGMSTHEIARREGSNQKSVHESIEAARKKLKKFYSDTPSN